MSLHPQGWPAASITPKGAPAMTTSPLGIDISKLKFDACLVREGGKLRHRVFPNTPAGFAQLSAWLAKHQVERAHACLEATGAYGEALATYLHEAGHMVSVVNPAQIKAYAQSRLSRAKTDKADATLIAQFCAERRPPRWQPATAGSAGVAGARPPPRLAAGDAADGGQPPGGGRAPRLSGSRSSSTSPSSTGGREDGRTDPLATSTATPACAGSATCCSPSPASARRPPPSCSRDHGREALRECAPTRGLRRARAAAARVRQ